MVDNLNRDDQSTRSLLSIRLTNGIPHNPLTSPPILITRMAVNLAIHLRDC